MTSPRESNSTPGDGRRWDVAILGATGVVGRVLLECLEASPIRVNRLRLLSTARSAGKTLFLGGRAYTVEEVSEEAFEGIDLALFSAGGAASAEWGPRAVAAGAWVVDNSSQFRMHAEVPLVVPEVNPHTLPDVPSIVANPNCSTIQMVVALAPIHRRFGLARVHVCTYQAASGSGHRAVSQLHSEIETARGGGGNEAPRFYPHRLHGNVIPHCDVFLDDGFTREEQKMIEETRKILGDDSIWVHPTCVRVPVEIGHSEAVFFETRDPASLAEVRNLLEEAPGVAYLDDPAASSYPMPAEAAGTDPVWVGRLRKDRDAPQGFHFWVVADNLRKGAAVNALQIAELIWERAGEGR